MIYAYATNETGAQAIVARERKLGRRSYVIRLRADCFEVRSW